jgi:hypothetical protein
MDGNFVRIPSSCRLSYFEYMNAVRCLALAMLASVGAAGAPVQLQSSGRQEALVELYTSEGCSSCPRAESWLTKLKEKPGLWSEFVPVAFHVDYWNNLGWPDKWSSKQYSDRQSAYAEVWGSANIYTPEFVLNGKEWHNWFGLKGAPGSSGVNAGILKVTSEDTHNWHVLFNPAPGGTTSYEVNAALLLSGLGSDVKAGENSGRHLIHDFVAVALINRPLASEGNGFEGVFTIASAQKHSEGRLALAVWTTVTGRLEPVQCVGGWLVESEAAK